MFESVGQFRREETHPAATRPIRRVAMNPVAGRTDPLASSSVESLTTVLLPPAFGSMTSMVRLVVAPDSSVASMTTEYGDSMLL